LVDHLGVSRITVRRALNELAASGLVKRRRGKGTIVTFNAGAPNVKASFENLIEGLTRMGVETVVKLIDCKFVKPENNLADMMELDKDERVQRIVRLRLLDDEPFSYLITHIPEHIAADYDSEQLTSASLIKLLEQSGHAPCAAHQTITAVGAEKEIADALGVAPGAPIMRIHRIMRDVDGVVVQEITAHYRADRFQYQMDLTRQRGSHWAQAE
jgi:GntR family transcriptional regulator